MEFLWKNESLQADPTAVENGSVGLAAPKANVASGKDWQGGKGGWKER